VSSTGTTPLAQHFQEVQDPLNSQWSLHDRGEICQSWHLDIWRRLM